MAMDAHGNAPGAARAVELLSRREITAEALVQDCLDRIAAREDEVQAWEALDADGALREARRIDGLRERPLLCGLPVGIKDVIDTAALPTAYGSPHRRGHRPSRDAACVRTLREAGAIVLGKTVTTEYAVYQPGKTRNPHDPAHTPGGSSSGSAAAVACGMVPLAVGTQTAGSVIRPASFCGVIGWKPTFGWALMEGIHPIAPSLDTLGFFVRDLPDVPLTLAAFGAGPRALPAAPEKPLLALCRTEMWERAEPAARSALEEAAATLARNGAEVRELQLPPAAFDRLGEAQIDIMGAEAAVAFRDEKEPSAKLREFLDAGARVSAERLAAAKAQAARCRREIESLLEPYDAALTLSAPGEAPAGLGWTGDPAFNRIWTLLGNPVASLPLLHGPRGLPIGLQLVGGIESDEALLAACRFALAALGG
jgi:amidase